MFGPFGKPREGDSARRLYDAVVKRARTPALYQRFRVPDTVDGRFDLVALHAFLILRRLKRDHARTARLAQALFDLMFADMDESLREMGVGDLSVGRRVKQMAKAFRGRVAAYAAGLDADGDTELAAALGRNLYRGGAVDVDALAAMAAYVRHQAAALDAAPLEALIAGTVAFAPLAGGQDEGAHADATP